MPKIRGIRFLLKSRVIGNYASVVSENPVFKELKEPLEPRRLLFGSLSVSELAILHQSRRRSQPVGTRREQAYDLRASKPKSRCTASYQASSPKAFQSTHCSSVIDALQPTNGAAFGPGM